MSTVSTTRVYQVAVPKGIRSGDSFLTKIGDENLFIRCPAHCQEGTVLEIKIIKNEDVIRQQQRVSDDLMMNNQKSPFAAFSVTLCLIVFILSTLAYSLVPYAKQKISSSCGLQNNNNNQPIDMLYYFLFDGLSSSPASCSSKRSQFW